MAWISISDITGAELGRTKTKAEALAIAKAYDTPARKAAHTKRTAGTLATIAQAAARTRTLRTAAQVATAAKAKGAHPMIVMAAQSNAKRAAYSARV